MGSTGTPAMVAVQVLVLFVLCVLLCVKGILFSAVTMHRCESLCLFSIFFPGYVLELWFRAEQGWTACVIYADITAQAW